MYVVATAGHVDHGKSTLVQRLTGMEPDRWEEEKRRGLTIDLGFVWTRLPSGRNVAFVDVPGHERFLGNTLAGLAPVDTVLFVVAADKGWQQQSTDHLAAAHALGKRRGVVALTRVDKASREQITATRAAIDQHLAETSLRGAPVVEVSAPTGQGVPELMAALDEVLAGTPQPHPEARVRMWIDRAFTIKGAGTVVTGTLQDGQLRLGQEVEIAGQRTTIRSLQSQGQSKERVVAQARVAVNLRGIDAGELHRGDYLATPGAWWVTDTVNVRHATGEVLEAAPREVMVNIGTTHMTAKLRRLGHNHAQLGLPHPVALSIGDRMILRKPGDHEIFAGVEVSDVTPLRPRDITDPTTTVTDIVARRGAIQRADLARMGWDTSAFAESIVVDPAAPPRWAAHLRQLVEATDAMHHGITAKAAIDALDLPLPELLERVVAEAGLALRDGKVVDPSHRIDLGKAEKSVRTVEQWLEDEPFNAPTAAELAELRLGTAELAAAEKAGRLLRLPTDRSIVLGADAARQATARLAKIPQPFTLSDARKAWETSRRVAVPLVEYLDQLKLTRRQGDTRTLT